MTSWWRHTLMNGTYFSINMINGKKTSTATHGSVVTMVFFVSRPHQQAVWWLLLHNGLPSTSVGRHVACILFLVLQSALTQSNHFILGLPLDLVPWIIFDCFCQQEVLLMFHWMQLLLLPTFSTFSVVSQLSRGANLPPIVISKLCFLLIQSSIKTL